MTERTYTKTLLSDPARELYVTEEDGELVIKMRGQRIRIESFPVLSDGEEERRVDVLCIDHDPFAILLSSLPLLVRGRRDAAFFQAAGESAVYEHDVEIQHAGRPNLTVTVQTYGDERPEQHPDVLTAMGPELQRVFVKATRFVELRAWGEVRESQEEET